jgi:hypothetical protein
LKRESTEAMDFNGSGEIIATRMLHVVDEQGNKRPVSVLIGKPEPAHDARGYACSYQIIGLGDQETEIARGADAVQALQSAMILIGANLHQLNHEVGGRLVWNGAPKATSAFREQSAASKFARQQADPLWTPDHAWHIMNPR